MSEEIDKHVLRKYEVQQRLGKGVSPGQLLGLPGLPGLLPAGLGCCLAVQAASCTACMQTGAAAPGCAPNLNGGG